MAEDEKPKHELPPGYTDDDAFLRDARDAFQLDMDADRENRDAALDDLKFAANYQDAQWDSAVRASRAGRPCLTNNVIPQYVGQVIGDSRINKPAIKVRPAEDADKDLAEVREGVIRAIERNSDAAGVYAKAAQPQVTCGIGAFRIGLTYADDETFNRDIKLLSVPNPLSVVWDCMATERTGRDARRCFVNDDVPTKEFEKEWPKAQPTNSLDSSTQIQLGQQGWVTRDTTRVTEYWLMVEEKVTLGLTRDGKTIDLDKAKGPVDIIQKRKVARKRPWMYLITGHEILEGPYKIPLDRLPIIKVMGQEYQVGEAKVWFGLVRFMKDEQRLQNYADSVIAETLALAPKAQWVGDSTAVEGREEEIRNSHRTGDPLLVKNAGGELTRVDPPVFPVALLQWRQTLTQSMKDVTGLHDASLGISSNETSGKAILARQREGDVATVVYHDNLNASIAEGGRVINQLIPLVYDTARTIRIVGPDDAVKVVKINDPNDPDSVDMTQGKYDIVVETGPSYSTKRVEAAESMLAFVQAVPSAAAAAADLIAKAQDWPMAEEIGERLHKMLPPGIADKDPDDMSPEEQQAAQQQQQVAQQQQQEAQQLAQGMAQAELTTAQANARKAAAEAQKAENEAMAPPPPANDQQPQEMLIAQVAEAVAKADKAAADADAARAKAEEAEARAVIAVGEARRIHAEADRAETDADFNEIDTAHKVIHGRGITDPEPTAAGEEVAA